MGSGLSKKYTNTYGSAFKEPLLLKEDSLDYHLDIHSNEQMQDFYLRMIQRESIPNAKMADNLEVARKEFEFNSESGYFGKASSSTKIREIKCDDPIAEGRKLFGILSNGGITKALRSSTGVTTSLYEGNITYRELSKSGGPAVDISVEVRFPINMQKIHFEVINDD